MRRIFLVLLATFGVSLCGCVRHYQKIVLMSDRPVTPIDSEAALPKPSLTAIEVRQIERQCFERLLNGHFGDDGDYSAIFLQADEAQTSDLMKAFPKHVPPIKQLWHANIRPGFTPLDKDNGKPALIFSVEVGEPENDTLHAVAKWYAGEAVKGFYLLTFQQVPAGWILSPE
jgi:hypothetical protein